MLDKNMKDWMLRIAGGNTSCIKDFEKAYDRAVQDGNHDEVKRLERFLKEMRAKFPKLIDPFAVET